MLLPGFGLLLLLASASASAADIPASSSLPLCLPGVYARPPEDCLPAGPSAYLTQMGQHHLRFPIEPLPAHDAQYSPDQLPYQYLRVTTKDPVRIFSSPEDAELGEVVRETQRPGLVYYSFDDSRMYNNKRYYMIEPGAWMRPDEVNASVAVPDHVGLELIGTPKNHFGFTLYPLESQLSPGISGEASGKSYERFGVVQVYDWQEAEGEMWLMIGPDEWLNGAEVAVVYPTAQPPEGVTNGRWIEVNLYEQTIAVYQDNHMVFATLASTGQWGWWTQPGLFQIYEKKETTHMRGAFEADFSDFYFLEDVPWTMYFDQLRALHGAYWHNAFGQPRTHGCVNLSPGDALWLYNWSQIGDWVYVWDPSGATPTDPSLYSEGGT